MKKILSLLIVVMLLFTLTTSADSPVYIPGVAVKSLFLIEASSGKILYEYNSHESLPPASVTKIMTMLLICEAIEDGKITLETQITASERAKSMGGSTIFLETNEVMSLDDLLKGIAVASANDACVAVAEHLSGSVEAFVALMNKRAQELGMKDTNFVNCNGLDAQNHYTSAHDIAVMSRELLKHPMIEKYTTIWMDSLRNGKFQLANTNKLIRFYKGANGLKTGSTSNAGCCISATAKRDGMQLIAVVMGAENSKDRFNAASELLNFGFSNYTVTNHGDKNSQVGEVKVLNGKSASVVGLAQDNTAVVISKKDKENLKTHINLPKEISAPVKKGDVLGDMVITLEGETLVKVNLIADRTVKKKGAQDYFICFLKGMFIHKER